MNRTVIVATHDAKVASAADQLYAALGYRHQPHFMSAICGTWLGNDANR